MNEPEMSRERFETLVVQVVDGVASPAEREELMDHVSRHPELAAELEAHRALKAVTDGWVDRLELDLAAARRREPRWLLATGWSLLLAGAVLLAGGGTWEMLRDPEVPISIRLGTALAAAGLVVLLGFVGVRRMTDRRSDRYLEVKL